MFRRMCIVLATACAAGAGVGAHAQGLPQQPAAPPARTAAPAPGADLPDALPDAQLAVMLDTYAMFQAQEQLAISDERFGTFAGRLKKLQDTRRRNQRQRLRIVQELRRLAGPRSQAPGDETAIRAQLAALRAHDDRAAAELRAAYDALDEVLDARQQARYRILEEQIERRKLDLILRAQEKARQTKQ
jgi:hypothetical protein